MKKILFISNISNKITNFSLPSILATQKLGYEFHLAANLSGFIEDPIKYNIKTHHIDLARNPFNLKNIKAYKQMLDLLKKEQFDAIHCNTPIGGVLGRLCGKKLKVRKIIYTAHGFHFYKGAPIINNTIFKLSERWLANYTDTLITMNQEDYRSAKEFKLRNNGRVYYVPGVGVDTEEFQQQKVVKLPVKQTLGLGEDDIVLISMGDLIHRKNYETAIRAIAKANNSKVHYLICGDGPLKTTLEILTKELGIENQIHFLGFRTDIKELLVIADIFFLTSYQEGLPRSMMEAMAAGLPSIASKIRGNTDLIKDEIGGYLRNPDDIDGFAEVINKLALDKNLRKSMRDNNLINIKKYDVENVKRQIKEIYERELI